MAKPASLFGLRDPQAIADAVVRMMQDYPFRLRAAELGRKKVIDEFEINKETKRLNECLLESCDGVR